MPRRDLIAFLPDEDSFGLGPFIRHHPVLTYADVGLTRGASDEKVAEHAREHEAIVITRNVWDFKRVMRVAAEVSTAGECQAMHCHEGGSVTSCV